MNKKFKISNMVPIMCFLIFIIFIVTGSDASNAMEQEKNYSTLEYDIVFLGDSITYKNDWAEFEISYLIKNSGINGNKTRDIIPRLKSDVYFYKPKNVILLIGINDIANDIKAETIVKNVGNIVDELKENLPNANIYLESIYPINNRDYDFYYINSITNKQLENINKKYQEMTVEKDIQYIDMYSELVDNEKMLKKTYTTDGLHLSRAGYVKVAEVLYNMLQK